MPQEWEPIDTTAAGDPASVTQSQRQAHDFAQLHELRARLGQVDGLALLFKALADDTRVCIAYALTQRELCVHEVARLLGVSAATASHHLRLLHNLGLARYRRDGKHVYYSLDDNHVTTLIEAALEHFLERRHQK